LQFVANAKVYYFNMQGIIGFVAMGNRALLYKYTDRAKTKLMLLQREK